MAMCPMEEAHCADCAYNENGVCSITGNEVETEKESISKAKALQLCEALRIVNDEMKKLKDKKTKLEGGIKEYLSNNKLDVLSNNDVEVATIKEVTSYRFDSKSFKEEHADLYKKYTKESKSKRFTLKKLKTK